MIGDVHLGEGSSLWHGTIVRGDMMKVTIGKNTTVQDLVRIGTNTARAGDKISIGENV